MKQNLYLPVFGILSVLSSLSQAAPDPQSPDGPTVPCSRLLGIQETIAIQGVRSKGIVSRPQDIIAEFAIRLFVDGSSGCGDQFLVQSTGNQLQFFQLGSLLGHPQPGCDEVFEYYWAPQPEGLPVGGSTVVELRVGPTHGTSGYYRVTTIATKRFGPFPSGMGTGRYFEYAEPTIEEVR